MINNFHKKIFITEHRKNISDFQLDYEFDENNMF